MGALKRFFKNLYDKLVKINGTPQRVALGLGLGVFMGVFPGTGPLAAFVLAIAFRVNRASAILGSFLTNTWISFVILIPAIKVGSVIFKVTWEQIYLDWLYFLRNLHWATLFKLSLLKLILPVVVGYLALGFCLGLAAYLLTLLLIRKKST